MMKLKYTMHCS